MSDALSFTVPLMDLSREQTRILAKLLIWTAEFETKTAAAERNGRRVEPVTTKTFSTHFRKDHKEMLKALKALERDSYLFVRTRLSAGPAGNGYDGALFAAVKPLPKCYERFIRLQRDWPGQSESWPTSLLNALTDHARITANAKSAGTVGAAALRPPPPHAFTGRVPHRP